MSEPVNSVTMKVLQPLWNESSPRTNKYCLAYFNYSYSRIGPKERALRADSKVGPNLKEKVWYSFAPQLKMRDKYSKKIGTQKVQSEVIALIHSCMLYRLWLPYGTNT